MLGLRLRIHRHVVVNTKRGVQTRSARPISKPATAASKTSQRSTPAAQKTNARPQSTKWGFSTYAILAFTCYFGLYSSSLLISVLKANNDQDVLDITRQKDVVGRYDEIADSFDSDVNFSEWLMGILNLRKKIAKACVGDVLEVSCGTGRNLGYFQLDQKDRNIRSLTMIDLSPQMVQVCKRKFLALRAKSTSKKTADDLEVRFIAGSALDEMPLTSAGKKYDTIVQTMGLCSTAAPVELVVNMARHLDISNPDARIYLLEHGRGNNKWINNVIDSNATKHAEAYGCWYNRELNDVVNEAAKRTGFEVVRVERHYLGTTYFYELKAGPKAATCLEQQATVPTTTASAQSTWKKWFSKEG